MCDPVSEQCNLDKILVTIPTLSLQNPPHDTLPQKQWKRMRTVFFLEELVILTQYYEQQKFLDPDLKVEIPSKIDMPNNVLVMWLQNRRATDRANGILA